MMMRIVDPTRGERGRPRHPRGTAVRPDRDHLPKGWSCPHVSRGGPPGPTRRKQAARGVGPRVQPPRPSSRHSAAFSPSRAPTVRGRPPPNHMERLRPLCSFHITGESPQILSHFPKSSLNPEQGQRTPSTFVRTTGHTDLRIMESLGPDVPKVSESKEDEHHGSELTRVLRLQR